MSDRFSPPYTYLPEGIDFCFLLFSFKPILQPLPSKTSKSLLKRWRIIQSQLHQRKRDIV